ncbi:hypothetical protein SAMN05216251_11726 [Actinacidiphila alni]|uniref:Nuclear transport factor 2 family protein n=1 Tax=Actinacidiphila alni TaxID=380248 RepID=A0A1I2JAF7_9ACTN|nr:hypothetical protein [Actinacidiphila alni]SFF51504.1 hypothetical protein SAMN05216251_11726 [Actinacidiphila alni]
MSTRTVTRMMARTTTRVTAGVAVAACVVLVASGCGPKKSTQSEGSHTPTATATSRTSASPTPTATTPSATPSATAPSTAPAGGGHAPRTKAGAIQRYEQFLHAVGREDLDTVCDVAGPAAKKAEDEGLGPCRSTFPVTFKMISPPQKKALRSATVDPARVVVETPDKIEMPADSVRASVTFTDSEIGSSTLEYLKNDWYITD